MKQESFYYNFRTGDYDARSTTPDDWSDYLPQNPPAQNLYRLYLKMGDTPDDAALKVLSAVIEARDAKQ